MPEGKRYFNQLSGQVEDEDGNVLGVVYQDKLTGQLIHEFENRKTPIPGTTPPAWKPPKESTITRAPSAFESFERPISVASGAMAGAELGSAAGLPGAIAGSLAGGIGGFYGTQIKNALRTKMGLSDRPIPSFDPKLALKEASINTLTDQILGGAPKVAGKLFNLAERRASGWALDKFTNLRDPNDLDTLKSFLEANPNAPRPNVPQLTNSETAKLGVAWTGRNAARELFQSQEKYTKGQINRQLADIRGPFTSVDISPSTLSESAATKAIEKKKYLGELERAAHETANSSVERTVKVIPKEKEITSNIIDPTTGSRVKQKVTDYIPVKAPIVVTEAKNLSNDVLNSLDNLLKEPDDIFLTTPSVKAEAAILRRNIADIANAYVDPSSGVPITSYTNTKAIRQGITDILENMSRSSEQVRARYAETLKSLRRSLSKAEYESFGISQEGEAVGNRALGYTSEQASNIMKAKQLTQEKARAFKNTMGMKLSTTKQVSDPTSFDIIYEDTLNQAATKVEHARNFVKAAGREDLAAQHIKNAYDAATANNTWNGQKFFDYLFRDHADISRVAIPAANRAKLRELAVYGKFTKPNLPESGWRSLDWRLGAAVISLPPGLIQFATTGNLNQSAMTSGLILATIPMSRRIVGKMLNNPKSTEYLLKLQNAPPNSNESFNWYRRAFQSLGKGTQLYLTNQDGQEVGIGDIQKDGTIKVN